MDSVGNEYFQTHPINSNSIWIDEIDKQFFTSSVKLFSTNQILQQINQIPSKKILSITDNEKSKIVEQPEHTIYEDIQERAKSTNPDISKLPEVFLKEKLIKYLAETGIPEIELINREKRIEKTTFYEDIPYIGLADYIAQIEILQNDLDEGISVFVNELIKFDHNGHKLKKISDKVLKPYLDYDFFDLFISKNCSYPENIFYSMDRYIIPSPARPKEGMPSLSPEDLKEINQVKPYPFQREFVLDDKFLGIEKEDETELQEEDYERITFDQVERKFGLQKDDIVHQNIFLSIHETHDNKLYIHNLKIKDFISVRERETELWCN